MREYIDGALFKDMIICASAALEINKQRVNELNVFPVPDGDTGTNMSLTMANAVKELKKITPTTIEQAADCVAYALLRGARGNSGVILSLLFRGIAKSLKGREKADTFDFSVALAEGVDVAYKAVMKPAEGTILTVSRISAASAMDFARAGTDIEMMFVCTIESAKEALEKTTDQNPVLKRAGVIDSGGFGYVIILEAMLAYLQGRMTVADADNVSVTEGVRAADNFSQFDSEEINFTYCTEFIVTRETDKSVDIIRRFLDKLGDSIVVVDDDEIIKTHVHTNDPGKVLTEALTYGSLLTVKVENMREQHSSLSGLSKPGTEKAEDACETEQYFAEPGKQYGAVAVCAGQGITDLFLELGVDNVVTGGQTMNPSTEDILLAVNNTQADTVYVFPNNKNIIMAAEQCVPLADKKVVVIPTRTIPQGIAAMLSMDIFADEEELTETFNGVIKTVHTALVTYATRDSEFDGHEILAGEYLALLDSALVGHYASLDELFGELASALSRFEPELISVYYGEDVNEDAAEKVAGVIGERLADADVCVVNGGQPVYYYIISAE